jgi:LmbE family N-acetylglucosaminyl deacetylase
MRDSYFSVRGKRIASKGETGMLSRRRFALLATAALAAGVCEAQEQLKVLVVVAHPDDEYSFAAATYRIARELGGIVDQMVISNGEAGYRYSILAEQIYGLNLTAEDIGRANLPEIRKQESLTAGRILGIRQHHFLDQRDAGFTLDAKQVEASWDREAVRAYIGKLLREQDYRFVFTLLPTAETHGHHKAATILALEAATSFPPERRPVVFGVEASSSRDAAREFNELPGYPVTRVGSDVREFRRSQPFGFHDALNYEIIANWVIAAHKSQGLFQMDAGRHDLERFWRFEASGEHSLESARHLFERLGRAAGSPATQAARSQR